MTHTKRHKVTNQEKQILAQPLPGMCFSQEAKWCI